MPDIDTTRRIDSARNALVGKVPDPKSQVEQITLALIYKFMDDMDKESIEMGGKAKFFSGEFQRYAWTKIFSPQMSGHEIVTTYGEAIQRMNQNPKIPQLFRNIFKNAYLPYRDPETLKIFLKIIDEFKYDHSERLGDAFEYLLSVLGSQGEAGQFRTPRHIIDFMVEIVDPKKNDTILDPACGTAGFLISSYKHILKHNSKNFDPSNDPKGFDLYGAKQNGSIENGKRYKGEKLTPDDKERLAKNIIGYDISPDMVRLSLANMYLHGFSNPLISEYDTLASEDKWNEYADVIMANPPFMSPKGGVRPHKRFSVQCKRSEVLFVDYMINHLHPNGRAGIIVPEGIIFQSGNAYKQLRKNLLEHGLFAVVSLPSGVFLPYSGVKTSILFLDNAFAKKHASVLFIDIKDIGVSLGATQAPIELNDLIPAVSVISKFKTNGSIDISKFAFTADKNEIASHKYDLSSSKYRKIIATDTEHHIVTLAEVCTITKGKSSSTKTLPGEYRLLLTAVEPKTADHYDFDGEGVCVPLISATGHGKAAMKRVIFTQGKFALANLMAFVEPKNKKQLNPKYLYYCLDSSKDELAKLMNGAANVSMKVEDLEEYQIPLASLEMQEQIVAEIDNYQKVIDGARQIIAHWKPIIKIDPKWEMVILGELCEIKSGGTPDTQEKSFYEPPEVPWLKSEVCKDVYIYEPRTFISKKGLNNSSAKMLPANTPIVALVGATIGKTGFVTFEFSTNQNIASLITKDSQRLNPRYLFLALGVLYNQFTDGNSKFKMANLSFVKGLKIPLPPLEVQKQIVAQIEEEQRVVEGSRKLMELYQAKIKSKIAEVWGE